MTKRDRQLFAQLLTEGVYRISLREFKSIRTVQDELGYSLGKLGGSMLEYWRKEHLPRRFEDVEQLTREIVRRGGMDRTWAERFLTCVSYPTLKQLCQELFPDAGATVATAPGPQPRSRPAASSAALPPAPAYAAPFIAGPPLIHPRPFFGRERHIRRVFRLWQELPLQNVAVIGARRSGKTSLLHYMRTITLTPEQQLRPGQRRDWLREPERYQWAFVDFQDPRMQQQESLLAYLLTCLGLAIPTPCTLISFIDTLNRQLQQPTIILFDEINAALAAPDLTQEFWGGLRSLCNYQSGGRIAFMLSSQQPPAQLAERESKSSPFFNIFGYTFTLGPLTEAEAHELIGSSPLPFDREDRDWICQQSGCWPYPLQILCQARLNALQDHDTSQDWRAEGLLQLQLLTTSAPGGLA